MKANIFVLLISITTLFMLFGQGKNAVIALNLEPEEIQKFSELLPKYMLFPINIEVEKLSDSDASLFKEYSEAITPYVWGILFVSEISIIMSIIIICSIFKTMKQSIIRYIDMSVLATHRSKNY